MFPDQEAIGAVKVQAGRAPDGEAGQCAVLSTVCELRGACGNCRWATTVRGVAVCDISSTARGAAPVMLSIASRTPLAGSSRCNSPHMAPFFSDKNPPQKEPLANTCFFWPVVLDYKHSRLNGLGSPSGIETKSTTKPGQMTFMRLNGLGSPSGIETSPLLNCSCPLSRAKWPGKPVWD